MKIIPTIRKKGNISKAFLIKQYITLEKSSPQIAKESSCCFLTVINYLKKHDIPIRTKSEANKIRFKNPINNPNYKDGRCLKQYYCKDCGNTICYHTALYGQGRCVICSNKGKNNPNFGRMGKLNSSYIENLIREYPITFNKILKEQIRQRDNYQCQICGKSTKKNGRKLDIHHKDYNKNNINPKNLITLCNSCHCSTNFNRKIYIEYFGILEAITK